MRSPLTSSVPPGRIRSTACCATAAASQRCSSKSRRNPLVPSVARRPCHTPLVTAFYQRQADAGSTKCCWTSATYSSARTRTQRRPHTSRPQRPQRSFTSTAAEPPVAEPPDADRIDPARDGRVRRCPWQAAAAACRAAGYRSRLHVQDDVGAGPGAADEHLAVGRGLQRVSRDRRHQPERPGICSASAARHSGGSKGSAKYWVSWATRPPENSMMLTESEGTPS